MVDPGTLAAQLGSSQRLPSGWAALDGLLGGGWPLGRLAEIRGQGCTSLALGAVRQAQSSGRDLPVAWIDGSGSFCPATAPVDLARLTLVELPGEASVGPVLFAADILLRSRSYGLLVLDLPPRRRPTTSVWFRLARLTARAHTALLLLNRRDDARAGPAAGALSGSASALLLDVRLCPGPVPEWGEWPAPGFEVRLQRNRAAPEAGSKAALPPLRLPALG